MMTTRATIRSTASSVRASLATLQHTTIMRIRCSELISKYSKLKTKAIHIYIHRLTANTLSTLQKRFGPLPSEVPSPKKKMHPGINKEARTDADSLLDMIKSLQAEIKVHELEIHLQLQLQFSINQTYL